MRANVPVVNGYSGRIPAGYTVDVLFDPQLRDWLSPRFHGTLRILDPRNPDAPRELTVP